MQILTSTLVSLLASSPLVASPGTPATSTAPRADATRSAASAGSVEWRILRPDNTGIPGDYTQAIHLDGADLPWIAGYIPFWEDGGMAHWDGASNWEVLSSSDYPVIASPRFNEIFEAADGTYWIASDAGLLRYDPAVGPSSLERFDAQNTPLVASQIVGIDQDPEGRLWLAVHSVSGPGCLARFDPLAGTWNVWTTQNGLPWGAAWPGWNGVDYVAVVPDSEGYTVWFGNSTQGMATWRNGAFRWLQANPLPGPLPTGFRSNEPIDSQGNAWMTTNQGLARRSPDGSFTVTGYPAGLSTEVSRVIAAEGGRALLGTYYADVFEWDGGWSYLGNWGGGSIYALAEDSQGRVWAGGIGGAARLEGGAWQRYRLTNTGMLGYWPQTIDFDAAGLVYMNGNAGPGVGGFTIYDQASDVWTCVNDANYGLGPAWGLPADNVEVLCTRSDGTLALVAGYTLYSWDGASYTPIPGAASPDELAEDGLGRLWAGSYGRLTLIEGGTTTAYTFSNSPMLGGDVDALVADEQAPGYVWSFGRFGVAHTNGVDWTIYPRELVGLTVNTTSELLYAGDVHPDGSLWLGSGKGVFRLDTQTLSFTNYTKTNSGLPSDDVQHIHVAPDGSVWVATFDQVFPYPGGLTHFDGSTWTTYSQGSSPLPHNQIYDLASRPVPGGYELWVATASEGAAVLTVKTPRPTYGRLRPTQKP